MASSAITITVERGSAESVAALGPDFVLGLRKVMARAINNRLIEHMDKLEAERPNALGGTRTHFYGQVRDSLASTEPSVGSDGDVTISINQVGFAQRYFGGTITPTQGRKYLTIPARAEAYGRRASDFNDLHFVKTAAGGMLVQNEQQAIKIGRPRKDGSRKLTPGAESGGGVMFWLKTSVTQQPDPSVLPPDEAILAAATEAGDEYAELQLSRAAGGASAP